jgi:altronate hydrolase
VLESDEGVTVAGLVPPGHKVATAAIAAGEAVRRYDQVIGTCHAGHCAGPARAHAQPGLRELRAHPRARRRRAPTAAASPAGHLPGHRAADGRVATRNYIGVLTSVNCSATAARRDRRPLPPRRAGPRPFRLPQRRRRGGADARHGLRHRQRRRELQVLRRTLGGYARHPNFAAVLVVGLGCETNQIQG